MDAQWVLVMCVIALSIGVYRMSRRIDQKIDQAIAQSTSNPLVPGGATAPPEELGDDSF